MKIGSHDTKSATYFIAEIGGNHNGSPEEAYRLVEAAAKSGANAVKFQTYKAETLVHPSVEPVPIVKKHYATQLDRFKSLELSWEVYEKIFAMCETLGVDFLTTPFDMEILETFAPRMPAIKIASGDLTYKQLVDAAVATGKPVLLSTGASTLDEIKAVAGTIPAAQRGVLHCVSVYPLPDELANLKAISTLKTALPDAAIGYSDHTIGNEAVIAAATLGAEVIEAHFTMDKAQTPGDHPLSLDPDDLADAIRRIRRVEAMLGTGEKTISDTEQNMRRMIRRGVYAARDIAPGQTITAEDILIVRPTTALSPAEADSLIGKTASAPCKRLDEITVDLFS